MTVGMKIVRQIVVGVEAEERDENAREKGEISQLS